MISDTSYALCIAFLEADSPTVHPHHYEIHKAVPLDSPINYNHQLCDAVELSFRALQRNRKWNGEIKLK